MRPLLFRLTPGSDLKRSILDRCALEKIQTGVIVSCVGSLSEACLRTADGVSLIRQTGPFELTSLSGTITEDSAHLHCSLFDHAMNAIGGHVMEGCLIHTTMEICILDLSDEVQSARLMDPSTGYDELVITPKSPKPKPL